MDINRKKNKIKTAFLLLTAVLLTGFVGFTYAKYISNFLLTIDSADSAKWGTIELREYLDLISDDGEKAEFDRNGSWVAIKNNSTEKLYDNLAPGISIPKHPFVHIEGTFEVSFWLYLKVEETDYNKFDNPAIFYHVNSDNWLLEKEPTITTDARKTVKTEFYKYSGKEYLPKAGESVKEGGIDIDLLQHCEMHVSNFPAEDFKGYDLKFSIWIEQLDDNSGRDFVEVGTSGASNTSK